jgi:hypothetical protein
VVYDYASYRDKKVVGVFVSFRCATSLIDIQLYIVSRVSKYKYICAPKADASMEVQWLGGKWKSK